MFDAPAVERIGLPALEAMRRGTLKGYRNGGYVTGGRTAGAALQRAAVPSAQATQSEPKAVFEINVAGIGDAQIAAGVRAAIERAFDEYDRTVFAGRVRMVVNDDWAA